MNKTASLKRAALCVFLLSISTGAIAQQTYDPMRPANPMMPSAPASAPAAPTAQLNPEFGNLPEGEGMEDTYYQCIACHSTAIIRQQRLSDARWDYLWTWMVEVQGMYEPDEETKDTIMAYLKTHFSSER